MAATCSLPLQPTLQSWQTGDSRSPASPTWILPSSYTTTTDNDDTSNNNTSSSIAGLGQRPLPLPSQQLQERDTAVDAPREMDKTSVTPRGVLDSSRQVKPPPSDTNGTASFGMTIKHGEPAPILKRSYSTPTVRSMAQESTLATGEKKRNKLGYHRTSIACSHCRRRKIRCIVSPDIQNRCINCIRLKKDCSFYPVDQQPIIDSRGKPTGAGLGNSTGHSQSSSPALVPGHPVDMASRSLYAHGSIPDSMAHGAPAILPSNIGYSTVSSDGLVIHSDHNFSASPGSSLAWGSAEPSPVTMAGSMEMSYGWRPYPGESTVGDQVSQFTPGSNTSSVWMTGSAGGSQSHDWNWTNGGIPPPSAVRSMSFSGELSSHPHSQFVPVPSNAPYSGGGPEMANMFSPPASQAPGQGQVNGHAGPNESGWQQSQQQMMQQPRQAQRSMEFESWGMSHGGAPPM